MSDIPVKALKKGLDVLSLLVFADPAADGFTVKELAHRMGMPENSAHNLLKTLAACGYAEKNHARRYIAGPVCRQIAFVNFQNDGNFREKVLLALQKLAADTDACLVFATLDRNTWRTVARIDSAGRFAARECETVQREFLYETATGRVLFSFSPAARRAELLRENPGVETAWPEMARDWLRIRAAGGCALFRARYGVATFAVPVVRGRRLAGALGAYCPLGHVNQLHDRRLFTCLRAAAQALAAP